MQFEANGLMRANESGISVSSNRRVTHLLQRRSVLSGMLKEDGNINLGGTADFNSSQASL